MRTAAFILAVALPLSALAAAPTLHHAALEDYLNQPILSVEIRGPDWAQELGRNMPIHKGMYLTRDKLKRSVLHFYQNRITDISAVRAGAEHAEAGGRKGIKLIFRIEPVLAITRIEFEDNGSMDQGSFHRSAGLQTGAEFWPENIDKSATQLALLYQRAGWRETEVEWLASNAMGGVGITFVVHRSDPTQLLRFEFPGDKRLSDEELTDVFPIKPGERLNMDQIDEGIVELKALLRSYRYYRAEVGMPVVDAADGQAIVQIPVNAGPRFTLQVRGNRNIDDATLLDHLQYTGEETLDPATELDLAKRLNELYELAGYPLASVKVRETPATEPVRAPRKRSEAAAPEAGEVLLSPRDYNRIGPSSQFSLTTDVPTNTPRHFEYDEWGPAFDRVGPYHPGPNELLSSDHGLPALDHPPPNHVPAIPPDRDVPIGGPIQFSIVPDVPPSPSPRGITVTFLITEGPPVRVVDKRIEGDLLHTDGFHRTELRHRLDLALEDAVPEDLVDKLDESWIRAAQLGGSPGEIVTRHPRVKAEEVFTKAGYAKGCAQIEDLYKAIGYLDARVGPAKLVPLQADEAEVVIQIVKGDRSMVESVPLAAGVRDMSLAEVQKRITVHVGDPLSYAEIDNTEKAVTDLYRQNGFLSASITDEEKALPNQEHSYQVIFTIVEGVQVRASSIEIVGAKHTPAELVLRAVLLHQPDAAAAAKFIETMRDNPNDQVKEELRALEDGDLITPKACADSVQNLLNLGTFTSASVHAKSITSPETPLVVEVQERPSYTVDYGGGISEVDGPRARSQFTAAHFLGTTDSFNASAKVNVPVFRICEYGIVVCVPGAQQPTDPVEWRGTVGMGFPVFGAPDEPPLEQHLDLIAQNVLRPAYYLNKYSVLGTINGLPHWRWGTVDNPDLVVSTQFQAEVERDFFDRTSTNTELITTLADQAALRLPTGPTQLLSLRPQISFDWRKGNVKDGKMDKHNPNSGALVTLILDFSRSFDAVIPESILPGTKVAMISALLTAGGYIPIYKRRRVVLFLNSRLGDIFSEPWADVIGTKVFFLGGTSTLRGFAEDSLIPQDVRDADHAGVKACNQLASGLACSGQSTALLASPTSVISPGGRLVVAGRGELRFAVSDSLDGNVFVDAGNLWSNPALVDLSKLRYSTGFGVAYPSPIGPAAIDLGFNLSQDTLVGESLVQLHFALGM